MRVRTAMVLAAGEGRRLRPLTLHTPKPLIDVAGIPLLDRTLTWLDGQGFDRIVVNVHHLADLVARHLEAVAPQLNAQLFVSRERTLLGTGGGIRKAAPLWLGPWAWIVNGDVVSDVDLRRCESAMDTEAEALMVARPDPDADRHGALFVEGAGEMSGGRLVGLLDQGRTDLDPLMFTGIHLLHRSLAQTLPREGCVVRDGYLHWLNSGNVRAWVHSGYWSEIGTPERLEAVRAHFQT